MEVAFLLGLGKTRGDFIRNAGSVFYLASMIASGGVYELRLLLAYRPIFYTLSGC